MTSLHSLGATVPQSCITPDAISATAWSDMVDRSEASATVQEKLHYIDNVFPKEFYMVKYYRR